MYCEPSAKPLPLTFTRVPPTDAPLLGLIEATLGCSWKTKTTEALPTNCCAFSDTRTLTAPVEFVSTAGVVHVSVLRQGGRR